MSNLVIAQTNSAGVQMSATTENTDTSDIVITFVSSVYDAAGSIDKSFPASLGVPGSFELTDADLTTLFGADNLALMKAGGLSPALSMSASAYNVAGEEQAEQVQTTINGATLLNQMYYRQFDLPEAPVEVSVTPSNNKLTIAGTVASINAVSNLIKLTVHKVVTGGLGTITNSTITGTVQATLNGPNTFQFVAEGLENGNRYEIFAKFANIGADGNLQYGPRNVVAFTGEPNTNPGVVSNVQVATALNGDVFHEANAATLNADWLKTETDPSDGQPSSYKLYVAKSDDSVDLEVAQPLALTDANGNAVATGATVSLAPASIPRSWFGEDNQIGIKFAIKQYYQNGDTKLGNLTTADVFKMIMPTLGPVEMISVNGAGLQTMTAAPGPSGAGTYTYSQTFNDADLGVATNTATRSYDVIYLASNKTMTFTYSVVDANDLNTPYSVTSSATLYAFKDPVGPATPTINVASFNADPVIGFVRAANANNNGYTISSYEIDVTYVGPAGGQATYGNPYSANFTYTNMQPNITVTANNGAAPYIAGDYKVTVSSVFSSANIPELYTQAAPASMGASSGPARWWTRPTIASIDVAGANMTITGNNGGALYTVVNGGAITSLGFTGTSEDSTLSKKSGAMTAASNGTALDRSAENLFDFSKLIPHDADLIDLSGDYLDGLGFVDADNAPSALSIAVFNTAAIADYTAQSAIGAQFVGLPALVTATSTAQTELANEEENLVNLQSAQAAAQAAYDAAVDALLTPVNLVEAASAAALAAVGAASAKGIADQDLIDAQTAKVDADQDLLDAQAAKVAADAAYTVLMNSTITPANQAALVIAVADQAAAAQAVADAEVAAGTAASDLTAADNAAAEAATALTAADNASSVADLALSTANQAVTVADAALTTANDAVTASEDKIVVDTATLDAATVALNARLALITTLGGTNTDSTIRTPAQQQAITAAALVLASRMTNPQNIAIA